MVLSSFRNLYSVSSEVKAWIQSYNEKVLKNEKIVVEFVDLCLTSIYQHPDVVMNAPLKRSIRRQYHEYVHQLLQSPSSGIALKAGDPISVSRETVVGFIETVYDEINTEI